MTADRDTQAHGDDYIDRTIATVRNHRDADNCWPQWANIFADEIEALRSERDALAARLEACEQALRTFAEKWDLHAADYLTELVGGEEMRILPAQVVAEMIGDVKRARAALGEPRP